MGKNLQKLNKMSMSKVKQNFHSDTESLINKQINMELYASYVYLSMAAYFARDDIALHGFAKRFKEASHEEREHAEKLIEYQTTRGGKVDSGRLPNPLLTSGARLFKRWRPASSLSAPSTSHC